MMNVQFNSPNLKKRITLPMKLMHPDAKVPTYGTDGAGCFDLYAVDSGMVFPNSSLTLATGVAFEVPEGYVLEIYSRSGHGFKNDIRLGNCVGIIDSDYRNEVFVKLTNDAGNFYEVEQGERIAQAKLVESPKVNFMVVEELSETARGTNGLGSTGR